MKNLTLLAISAVMLFAIGLQNTNNAEGALIDNPRYFSLDISGSQNPDDFPYSITCPTGDFRYIGLFGQGAIAKINKLDNTTIIYDNDAVASGQDWYSLVNASNNKIYANYKDFGLTIDFNTLTNTYGTPFPVVPNIAGGVVTYHSTYEEAPYHFDVAGYGQVIMGFDSYGELKYTNGYVWQVLNADFDFPAAANTAGAVDSSFNGIVRIDPSDNSVTRYDIVGSSALRGVMVDASDPTILWLTDISENKIFKFDTDTNTVTQTITLNAGTKPRGLTDDGTYLYVAMNQDGGSGNSKILKVTKSDGTTSEIDTGATNTDGGTFTVFKVPARNIIMWTDQSGNIGAFNTLDPTTTKVILDTTSHSDSNHFACYDSDQRMYFAGKGSVIQGSFSFGDSVSDITGSGGSSCGGDCYPPHFGIDKFGTTFYDDGLRINDKPYKMDNVLHVHNDKIIETPVGTPINFTQKIQDGNPEQIRLCEMGIGIPKGNYIINDASFLLTMRLTFDGDIQKLIIGDISAIKDVSMDYKIQDNNVYCSFKFTPTKHLQHDMFALQAIDQYGYNKITFVNKGYSAIGISLVGTPIYNVMDNLGNIEIISVLDQTLVDQTEAIDTAGNYWHLIDNQWIKDVKLPINTGTLSYWHGYDRLDPEFIFVKEGQELLAKQYFDSDMIQAYVNPVIEKEHISYGRLHDSVPNMMKAHIELILKNRLTKS